VPKNLSRHPARSASNSTRSQPPSAAEPIAVPQPSPPDSKPPSPRRSLTPVTVNPSSPPPLPPVRRRNVPSSPALPPPERATTELRASGVSQVVIDASAREQILPQAEIAPANLTSVVQLAAGHSHSLALTGDGIVHVWGSERGSPAGSGMAIINERLGRSTLDLLDHGLIPVRMPGLPTIEGISARENHSLALSTEGTVWAWGENFFGQLGDGTTTNRAMPAPISGLPAIRSISAGTFHSLALALDGSVWAWGKNNGGALGDGTTNDQTVPVRVIGLPEIRSPIKKFAFAVRRNAAIQPSAIRSVSAGVHLSLALAVDGTVWAWGKNNNGEVGDGTTFDRPTPVPVAGLPSIQSITAGAHCSLALAVDGTVWTWGWSKLGAGPGSNGGTTDRLSPVRVIGLPPIRSLSADLHSLALAVDGTVWAWGWNKYGQIGDGTTINRSSPVQITGLPPVQCLVASSGHSLAFAEDFSLWAWGQNERGQLGDGTTESRTRPIRVRFFS